MLKQALRLTLVALSIVLAGGVVACGGDDDDDEPTTTESSTATGSDEDQIREVADRFAQSIEDEDAELLCSVLAPQDVQQAGGGGLEECVTASDSEDNALFTAPDQDLSIEEVTVDPAGKTATATQAGGGFLTLVKLDGAWYITFGAAAAG